MRGTHRCWLVIVGLLAFTWFSPGTSLSPGTARGDEELGKRASWSPPSAAEAKLAIDQWLESRELDEVTRLKVTALWPEETGPLSQEDLLRQVAATIAVVEPAARPLVNLCRGERTSSSAPKHPLLTDEKNAPLVRHNLRLLYGVWLAQHDLYDEAHEQLEGLAPNDVVDPASLLFYQGVCYHRQLDKDKCLPLIAKLMEHEDSLPRRYETVARLMEADLKPLKTDSLDEIARLMDDVRRRLDLGRAGTRVRKQEDDVVAKLDKLIEEIEQQQSAAAAAAGASGGNTRSSRPAPDSANLGGKGPGNVDPKKTGNASGWGNLPPKERQEALQQISKELPAHYREVIEEYFRKLARDGGK